MSLRVPMLFILLLISSGFAIIFFAQRNNATDVNEASFSSTSPLEFIHQLKNKSKFSTAPLRGTFTDKPAQLSINGILRETNKHRAIEGLKPLSINSKLNQAAEAKTNDMFKNQYFEHISPTGIGPSDLVDKTGYKYLQTGENLALGNYSSDADLVQAWMDSPGHRENILTPGYDEIGLYAKTDWFDGHHTWLAVQTFATSITNCPSPDETSLQSAQQEIDQLIALEKKINDNQLFLNGLTEEVSNLSEEINNLADEGNTKIESGNQKIADGNEAANKGDTELAQDLWDRGETLQTEGQELHSKADSKRVHFNSRNNELELTREEHNINVDTFNSQNEALRLTNSDLNAEIRAYNDCLATINN